jgi:hypothetical protein
MAGPGCAGRLELAHGSEAHLPRITNEHLERLLVVLRAAAERTCLALTSGA